MFTPLNKKNLSKLNLLKKKNKTANNVQKIEWNK